MVEPDEGQGWKEVLASSAQDELERTGRGLLLSRAPSVLRSAGYDLENLLKGHKLSNFLATCGPPNIQLLQSDTNFALWVILPGDHVVTQPTDRYFPASRGPGESKRPPKFHPSVWKAFVSELPAGLKRWIDIESTFRFHDCDESEDHSPWIEVDRDFVRTDSLFHTNNFVVANIQNWAAKHDVALEKIVISENQKAGGSGDSGRDALGNFLALLTPSEQARISIPGDIVFKFSRNKGGD